MTFSPRTISIVAALIISSGMIGFAFWVSGSSAQLVTAGSTDELLKAYAKKDTDGDGLKDWEENLYGTDIENANSVDPALTDAEAVAQGVVKPRVVSVAPPTEAFEEADIPGVPAAENSFTKKFSEAFIKEYLAAGGEQVLDQAKQEQIVLKLLQQFTVEAQGAVTSKYTTLSVRSDATVDVDTYADAIFQTLKIKDVPKEDGNPVLLLQKFIEQGDTSARVKLVTLAEYYRLVEQNLLAVRVPPQFVDEHLLLLRAFDELGRATDLAVIYEQDPVAALGALSIYQPASLSFIEAVKGVAKVLLDNGAETTTSPAAGFFITIGQFADQNI